MALQADLNLLVASRDRDLSPETLGAIAQLSATCAVDLTVAHVTDGEHDAPPPLPLPFAAGEGPRRIQRLELAGPDAARAVAGICAERAFDVVLAPPRHGPVRWPSFRRSFRARLLDLAGTPVWTAGPGVPGRHFLRPLRTVACLLDFEVDPEQLLQRAAAFARRMEARLHVLAVLPPVDDGTLATVLTSEMPLLPAAAVARIEQMCAARPAPVVDVVVDGMGRGLRRLVEVSRPDLLFVRARQWAGRWPFGIARPLDAVPCPVVCVPDDLACAHWTFERVEPARAWAPRAHAAGAASAVGPWPAGASSRPI